VLWDLRFVFWHTLRENNGMVGVWMLGEFDAWGSGAFLDRRLNEIWICKYHFNITLGNGELATFLCLLFICPQGFKAFC
jgi:hypothetical protein